jgi:hypothetical protein
MEILILLLLKFGSVMVFILVAVMKLPLSIGSVVRSGARLGRV